MSKNTLCILVLIAGGFAAQYAPLATVKLTSGEQFLAWAVFITGALIIYCLPAEPKK